MQVTESLTGIGDRLGGVGEAMQRANDKVENMKSKADALEGLMAAGVLSDPLDNRSPCRRNSAR